MKDIMYAEQDRCRTETVQADARQYVRMTGRIWNRTDAGKDGCRTRQMLDRTDAGQDRCRTRQMLDRTDAGQELCSTGGM